MCYVCDYHCCSSSSGDHCGCEGCPQPLCHSHARFAEELDAHTSGQGLAAEAATTMRQGVRDEIVAQRGAVHAERAAAIVDTGQLYPDQEQRAFRPNPFAATRPDEQPGRRVAGVSYDSTYRPPPLAQGPAVVDEQLARETSRNASETLHPEPIGLVPGPGDFYTPDPDASGSRYAPYTPEPTPPRWTDPLGAALTLDPAEPVTPGPGLPAFELAPTFDAGGPSNESAIDAPASTEAAPKRARRAAGLPGSAPGGAPGGLDSGPVEQQPAADPLGADLDADRPEHGA